MTSCVPAIIYSVADLRGVYHLRVVVLGTDQLPSANARVTSSIGGEPKQVSGGWEFDIPIQTKPADGIVSVYASVENAFLKGSTSTRLADSYYLTVTIQLTRDNSAAINGTVVDQHRLAVAGAQVSVVGQDKAVTTNEIGAFALDAQAAVGQVVRLRVQKGRAIQEISAIAGKTPVEIQLPIEHPNPK